MNESLKKIILYVDRKVDIKRFVKFSITGVLNTIVHLMVFTFCSEVLKVDAKIAQVCGYVIATANSYIINRNWTFNRGKSYSKTEILKFATVNLISMSLSVAGMYVFHDRLKINKYLCQIPIAFITTSINYFGNKIFVFKANNRR